VSALQIGLLGFVLLLALLAGSMPVGFVMAVVGLAGFALLTTPHAALSMATIDLFTTFSDYNLTTIPLFVLMGQVSFHTGISRGLFNAAIIGWDGCQGGWRCRRWGLHCVWRHLRFRAGDLGHNRLGCPARDAAPQILHGTGDRLYCRRRQPGHADPAQHRVHCVCDSDRAVYWQAVHRGHRAGLMIAAMFCVVIYIECWRKPELGPPGPAFSWAEKMSSLKGVWETVTLFALVMGGMFLGFYTATEAAAIGAAGTMIIGLCKRELTWRKLLQCLNESIRTSCMVMTIVAGAIIFGIFWRGPRYRRSWRPGWPACRCRAGSLSA